MYVDKVLSGIKAVQTLSRLNRAHPKKHDTFVLDFMNDADTIREAFADYYRTTILSEETDPNKLHDLKASLDGYQVYAPGQIDQLVELYLGGADRDQLDPILDACVAVYRERLDEDGQVDFKGKAKAFIRTYGFLSSILPYTNADWEKLSIFLNFLIPKLPAPDEDDLSKGILEAIDMDSYRVEKQAAVKIQLRRRRRGDRARADQRRRAQARAGARPALEHPQDLQRPVRQHPLDRRRPRSTGSSPRTSPAALPPTRPIRTPRRTRTSRTPASSTTRPRAGDDRGPEGRHGALQAVHGQRRLPEVADRHGIRPHLRGTARMRDGRLPCGSPTPSTLAPLLTLAS